VRARLAEGVPLDVGERTGAPVLGIEHEYRVFDGGTQLDFETLLHTLGVEGLRLDPTDPNAYRTPWGGLVTADGREAEVAIAPVAVRPGCTAELEWRTLVARRVLIDALPSHVRLDGYSTHVNLEVDDHDVVAAGRLFVKRFAPAMMLLLDRPTSPGLLVRPRCGRLEVGGEYCNGDQLRAAVTFAAASGLACAAGARSREARRHLPRAVRSSVRPSNIRAGWYVDRRAFGVDLYRDGRRTQLHWGARGTWTAQAHLSETWERARPFAEPLFDAAELSLVDRVVDGAVALPLEAPPIDEPDPFAPGRGGDNPLEASAFEGVVRIRHRPGYRVEPISIAWDAVAFRLRGPRDGIACIPRAALAQFFDDLEHGRLDEQIAQFLASPSQGRVLEASDQTGSPGLFDELSSPGAIVPPERVPGRGVLGNAGGGTPADSRRDKHRRARGPKRALVVAAVVAGVLVVGGGVVLATRGGDKKAASGVGASGAPAATSTADFTGKYRVTFTVTRTKLGASFVTAAPAVGSTIDGLIVAVTCTKDSCTLGFDPSSPPRPQGQAFGFPPLTGDATHLSGNFVSDPPGGNCPTLNAVIITADVTLQRDASGVITGFTGTNDLTHRDALFQDNGGGNRCASYDVTYSLAGTKL
jgi:hypothetical protein